VPNKHRSTEEDELTAAAGFEVRMLTVFFNDRLVHTLTLLPGGPTKDKLVRERFIAMAEAARFFDEGVNAQCLADPALILIPVKPAATARCAPASRLSSVMLSQPVSLL